jgi:hypothetical protein
MNSSVSAEDAWRLRKAITFSYPINYQYVADIMILSNIK